MCSRVLSVVAFGALIASGQAVTHDVQLPPDSPVAYLNVNLGNSTAVPRGGASQVELHATLTLRNVSQKRIRSIVLTVEANDVTAGGKGSVSLPSLNAGPGENFTVPLEVSLLRPISAGQGKPTVVIRLDGLLFEDLSFYGPDTRHSKRTMTIWELEARRDREYFKTLLAKGGVDALRTEITHSIARRSLRRPGVTLAHGRATVLEAEKEMALAFVNAPDAPVEATTGMARVAANQARDPRFEVLNRSQRPIEHVQIGWVVKDQQGREFQAASLGADVRIEPNASVKVDQDTELRLERPVEIQGMSGYVSSVQFAGGSLWIAPSSSRLRAVAPPSPEEQRLMQIYSRKGIDALVEELKRF